jgi:hypothetical protein
VLSDPGRRARYDRELRRTSRHERFVPVNQRAVEPEPLISEPVPVEGQPELVRPSYEALVDRLARNFAELGVPKSEHEEPLNFELILSGEEAERGVLIPFHVPVLSICAHCGGTGRDWVFPCDKCAGEGQTVRRDVLNVRVPGGVRDGTVFELSLQKLGIRNLWLRVHVRVEGH